MGIGLKLKTCKHCGQQYQPWSSQSSLNRFCGPVCAAKWGEYRRDQARAKAQRQDARKRREQMKTRSMWQREAQTAFNAFIRERDRGVSCVSCGAPQGETRYGGAFDCGHYRSTGSSPHLRFHTFNAAAQCVRCNRDLSGNTVAMRMGLIARWGEDRVRSIEADDTPRQYSSDDLKRIKRIFRKRANLYARLRNR